MAAEPPGSVWGRARDTAAPLPPRLPGAHRPACANAVRRGSARPVGAAASGRPGGGSPQPGATPSDPGAKGGAGRFQAL